MKGYHPITVSENREKWEEAISQTDVFHLCLLEILVVKNEVKLEKKTVYGKNKG